MNSKFSPLNAWLQGNEVLPEFYMLKGNSDNIIQGWVSIDICLPLYKAGELEAQSLSVSWEKYTKYIKNAMDVIDIPKGITLDKEEAYYIKEQLGDPPTHCYPIYIITVGKGDEERIVYIGKTSSKTNRFAGGHRAGLKLHNPIYDGLNKNIYLAAIVFFNSNTKDYLPLEWIYPKSEALNVLDSIESKLIYHFQPELNIEKRNKDCCRYNMYIHIQNFTEKSNLLNDVFI